MKLARAWSQEPTLFLLRKLWQFSPGKRHTIVLYACMFVLANCIVLLPPAIFGALVREVQTHGLDAGNLPRVLGMLGLLFANVLLFWMLHGPARVLERSVAFAAEVNYRRHLLGCALDLGLTWHGKHDSGDTIDKVNKASEGILGFGQNVFQVIQVVVRLVGTAAALWWFSPTIGALAFGLVLLSFGVILLFDKRLVPQHQGLNLYSNQASAKFFDVLSNVTTAKILHIEQPLLGNVIGRYNAAFPLFRANASLHEKKWFAGAVCFQVVATVPLAFYICMGVRRHEVIDAGALSALYMYLTNLTSIYSSFSSFYQEIAIFKQRVLNAAPIEQAHASHEGVGRRRVGPWQRLSIQDVAFSYDGTDAKSNLLGVSLNLYRGERVALIGESGAGKSTFLKVLHGMYSHAVGRVQTDQDTAVATCFADLDLKTMLVPQEPEIFSATIRENMTLGLDCDEADLLHAARLATFDKVLAKLPGGLDTVASEKGVNFSGGQKQRLALTRVLLFAADKDLVLLDESTSSVDPHNEIEIYENIWKAFPDKTVVACIHKLNLLRMFDRIIIFAGGQVVDDGTFEGLLASNPSFCAAWKKFAATHPTHRTDTEVADPSDDARQQPDASALRDQSL